MLTSGSNVRKDLNEFQEKHATLVLTTVKVNCLFSEVLFYLSVFDISSLFWRNCYICDCFIMHFTSPDCFSNVQKACEERQREKRKHPSFVVLCYCNCFIMHSNSHVYFRNVPNACISVTLQAEFSRMVLYSCCHTYSIYFLCVCRERERDLYIFLYYYNCSHVLIN